MDALGTWDDAAQTNPAVRASGIALLKGILTLIKNGTAAALGQATMAASAPVAIASDQSSIPVKDAGPNWTSVHGVSGVPFTSADQHSAAASVTDAPTSGQKIVVTDIIVSVDTAMNITFKAETSGIVITGPIYVPANTVVQLTPRSKAWKLAAADKKLQVLTSVAGNIMVDAHYYSEP